LATGAENGLRQPPRISQPPVQPPESIRRQESLQSLVQHEFSRRERRAHALVERIRTRPLGAAALMRLQLTQQQLGFEPRPGFAGVVACRVGRAASVIVEEPGPRVEPTARFALGAVEIPVQVSRLDALQRRAAPATLPIDASSASAVSKVKPRADQSGARLNLRQ